MYYNNLDEETASGMKELQKRIAAHNLPDSALDKTLLIATWNIREFGNPGHKRSKKSLYYIAEILSQFDLIGIVELRKDVHEMAEVLHLMGPTWDIVYSDYIEDSPGNDERVGFVYDKRACVFTGLAGNASELRLKQNGKYVIKEDSWWRKPFMGSFRAGNFDFVMIETHIRWGSVEQDRAKELTLLADYIYARTIKDATVDRDVLVMGDFNIPSVSSDLYKAITARGLTMPPGLAGVSGSNVAAKLAKSKRYDQILYNPVYTKSVTDKGGVLDFYGDGWGALYPEASGPHDMKFTFQLSDHLPIWIMINTDNDGEQLDQLLAPAAEKAARHGRAG
jgi:endonuclease/exonuclease/phosphatase family metal-dependent hydrolase